MRTKKEKNLKNKIVIIALLVTITLIACIPLFISGIEGHFGQDLAFHLNRIEGLVTELKAGHFPVKMESRWMDGYGYPVAIYYGDLFLYIPAMLRLMGIGVVSAYKFYIVLITFVTAVFTYICIKKMVRRLDIALICSLIYTASSYRIVNVYIRGAVGEYSAMMFFPLIALAMYIIYKSDKDIPLRKQFENATLLMIGVTGLVNTHMLSTEIVGIILIVFCIINFKKTFTKSVLFTYVIAGVEIVIVNLFYIVPFVDYFISENVNINNVVGNARHIQESGLNWWEYFAFFKMPFANIEVAGDDRLLLTPGIVCILVLLAGIIFWIKGKTNKEMKIEMVSVIVLLFITSCYFPWNFIAQSTKLGDFLAQVQFPWRYMSIIVMILTILAARILERIESKKLLSVTYVIVICLTLVGMIWFTYEYNKYGELKEYETGEDVDSSDMGFIEYLRSGTVREDFLHMPISDDGIEVKEISHSGTDRTYEVNATADGAVTLPVVNYKGYQLESDDGRIDIYDGENNLIAFDLKKGFSGKIKQSFVQPKLWVIAEIISLLGLLFVIAILILNKKNNMEERK